MRKISYSVGLTVLLLFLISIALFRYSDFRKPKAQVIRIAYGAGGPVRKHFLDEMARHGLKWNLDIKLVTTEGAQETLNLVDQKGADLGLVGGAIEDNAEHQVVEITPLYMEPLQLLVKAELYESVSKDFGQLRGRSIAMDSVHSATNVLATELLQFIGLNDPAGGDRQYRAVHISQAQLVTLTERSAMPDAIFQIGGVPSSTLAHLVTAFDYRLVALPFGGAFNLSKFRQVQGQTAADGTDLALNKAFVEEAVIPAFVYSVLPPVPPADTRTVATRLMLVGSGGLDNRTVEKVLGLVMSPDISHIVEPKLSVELLDSSFQFQRHPGTDSYLASLRPFNVDGAFDAYQRMVEIWGILVALFFAGSNSWKWWKERRHRQRKHSVGDFMSQVLAVEAGVHSACSDAERIKLDQRLSDIKKESIELHLEGRLEDSENLQSLLVTLADARTRVWGNAG